VHRKLKQRIFIISLILATIVIGFVAYFIGSPVRVAKTTLSLLNEDHLSELKKSIIEKVENKEDVIRLSDSFDKCVNNIKDAKYSNEHLKNILEVFESMEKSTRISSIKINEFYKLVYSEL
jgi:hypothetical protein